MWGSLRWEYWAPSVLLCLDSILSHTPCCVITRGGLWRVGTGIRRTDRNSMGISQVLLVTSVSAADSMRVLHLWLNNAVSGLWWTCFLHLIGNMNFMPLLWWMYLLQNAAVRWGKSTFCLFIIPSRTNFRASWRIWHRSSLGVNIFLQVQSILARSVDKTFLNYTAAHMEEFTGKALAPKYP